MEFIIRMKTVTRILLFLVSTIVWLVALAVLNRAYLYIDDLIVVIGALILAASTTVGLAFALKT